jgi:hypothetical protein
MSQAAISNLCLSLPLPCGRASNSSKPLCWTLPHSFKPIGRGLSQNSIRAVAAGENRDNLDHLQRSIKHQESNPKKRVVPVAPIGIYRLCLIIGYSNFLFSLCFILCLALCRVVGPISNGKDGSADDRHDG